MTTNSRVTALVVVLFFTSLAFASEGEDSRHWLHLRAVGSVAVPVHPNAAERSANLQLKLDAIALEHVSSPAPSRVASEAIAPHMQQQRQYVVHTDVSSKADVRAVLQRAVGVAPTHYFPSDNYVMLLTADQVMQLSALPEVLYIGHFLPSYKVHPWLSESVETVALKSQALQSTIAQAAVAKHHSRSVTALLHAKLAKAEDNKRQAKAAAEPLAFSSNDVDLSMPRQLYPGRPVAGMVGLQAMLLPPLGTVEQQHSEDALSQLKQQVEAQWAARVPSHQQRSLVIFSVNTHVIHLYVRDSLVDIAVEVLSAQELVHWVELSSTKRPLNSAGAAVTQNASPTVNTSPSLWAKGLYGTGEIIGVGKLRTVSFETSKMRHGALA